MTRTAYLELIGKKPRKNDEDIIQRSLMAHLHRYADKRVVYFAVPNGEHRSKATGGKLKAAGVLAGVYDLVFFLPNGQAAVLELKREGGVVSAEQQEFGERCEAIGIMQAVAWSLDQALGILTAWGVLKRSR